MDLISRQAALHLITEYNGVMDKSVAKRLLMQMPSARVEERTDKHTETHACDWEEMLVICDNCGHAIRVKRH